jgi:SMC interacting uncharacterized protein involved in chromosome segregation
MGDKQECKINALNTENTMESNSITLEMLYNLLIDFKEETRRNFEQVDKRFEQVDKRFEQIDSRFTLNDGRTDRIENDLRDLKHEMEEGFREVREMIRSDRNKLDQVYEARNEVKVKFAHGWAFVTVVLGFLGGIAAIITKAIFVEV